MRVRITMPSKDAKRVGEKVKAECEEIEEEEPGQEWEAVCRQLCCWERRLMIRLSRLTPVPSEH